MDKYPLYLKTFIAAILICSFFYKLTAQPVTIDIWHGKIPGAIENPAYNPDTVYIDGNRIRLIKIVNPTLDMYTAKGDNNRKTAVIICPGGGYWRLAVDHEGTSVAQWLNKLGITAFVLKYRLPSDAIMKDKSVGPLQDAQEAIRIVRRNAKEWRIDPDKIGIMGFSAGGHLAATVSTHFLERFYQSEDSTSARPDFSMLIYPVISMDSTITHMGSRNNLLGEHPSEVLVKRFSNELQVTKETPYAFLVHASDDNVVPIENSMRYIQALEKYHIPCELHIYQSGGHGFGLGSKKGTESFWPESCERWLRARGLL